MRLSAMPPGSCLSPGPAIPLLSGRPSCQQGALLPTPPQRGGTSQSALLSPHLPELPPSTSGAQSAALCLCGHVLCGSIPSRCWSPAQLLSAWPLQGDLWPHVLVPSGPRRWNAPVGPNLACPQQHPAGLSSRPDSGAALDTGHASATQNPNPCSPLQNIPAPWASPSLCSGLGRRQPRLDHCKAF